MSDSKSRLQEIEESVNALLTQAIDLRKILSMYINEKKKTKEESEGSGVEFKEPSEGSSVSSGSSGSIKRASPEEFYPSESQTYPQQKRSRGSRATNKKFEFIYSALNASEKEHIVYDYISIGMGPCARKWGVERHTIYTYIQKSRDLFSNEEQKAEWIDTKRVFIGKQRRNLDLETVKNNIEYSLQKKGKEGISLKELCYLSFDRGIALASVRYSINLVELEFLLQGYCPSQWAEMEKNEWYLTAEGISVGESTYKIVKLAYYEGYLYAMKRYRVPERVIRKYSLAYIHDGVLVNGDEHDNNGVVNGKYNETETTIIKQLKDSRKSNLSKPREYDPLASLFF